MMRISSFAAAVSATVFLAAVGSARAQNTQVLFEASNNEGQSWHDRVSVHPGDAVYVRLRIRLINEGTNTVLGLAGITLQPRVTNWNPDADDCLPFTDRFRGVPEDPQTNTGRILPFGSNGGGGTVGLLCIEEPSVMRIIDGDFPTPPLRGVGLGQLPRNNNPTNFRTGTDVLVFRYAFRPGDVGERDLIANIDVAAVLQQRGNWYRTDNGVGSLLAPIGDNVIPATIHVIPAPAVSAALLLALAAPSRRRRPS